MANNRCGGFTLIELSIVLVIIGLIVGSILTGQDLINSAIIRAQVTQIERYNTAVRTFQNKYGGLPGDLQDPNASSFGFQPRGTYAGEGDGNGVLQSNCANANVQPDGLQTCGELAVFWEDLGKAGLIDTVIPGYDTNGNHYAYTSGRSNLNITLTSSPSLYQWFPAAKIAVGDFVYVYSFNGINYYAVSSLVECCNSDIFSTSTPGMTVLQAYNIDKKIDDGLPQFGNVTACYINYSVQPYYALWAAGGLNQGASGGTLINTGATGHSNCVPTTTATVTAYASTNCFDNNGNGGTQTYSLSQNANVQNCALSFRFQ